MIYFIIWLVCSVISYSISFAYFQKEFNDIAEEHYYEDMKECLFLSIFGPISLFSVLIHVNKKVFKYGLKFW